MKFPEHGISMCREYLSHLTEWPESEVFKIDGVHNFQIWKDSGKEYAAIINTITKEWQFIVKPSFVTKL